MHRIRPSKMLEVMGPVGLKYRKRVGAGLGCAVGIHGTEVVDFDSVGSQVSEAIAPIIGIDIRI